MHARLTLIVVVGVVTMAVIGRAAPAGATGSGGAWTDEAGVGARAQETGGQPAAGGGGGGSTGARSGRGGGSASSCTYSALDARETRIAEDMAAQGMLTRGGGSGTWVRRICPGSGVVMWSGAPGAAAAPAVDPRALAVEALSRAAVPDPVIGMSPPVGQDQIVNLPTWLWVEGWRPVTATASAGGVTVTVTATPDRVVWRMGNGDGVTCAGPGRVDSGAGAPSGSPPACSYTYRTSSARAPGGAFRLVATTTWRVAWTATGISAAGDLPAVTRTSSVVVRVAEVQAINQGASDAGGRR